MTMKRKRSAVGLIALLLIAGGAWFAFRGKARNGKNMSRTVAVEEGPIEDTVEATGAVAPLNRVEIQPPIPGRIDKLLVDEGARVKKGDIIAWMSSTDRAAILDAARAQGPQAVKDWTDSYNPTPIVAPMTGGIILRNVVVGQTVDAGTVLYAMSDSLIVLGQVDESDIARIRVGMPARITLDAFPNQKTPAKVFDILYEGKNVSNVITYGVKVKPDQVPSFFRSQMTANISFIVGHKDQALLIPASAVSEAPGGGKQVMVPGAEGKPVAKAITTGLETGNKVEVLSGLSAGDSIILARGKYVPQQGVQSSPLALGGRPGQSSGGGGGGSQGSGGRRAH